MQHLRDGRNWGCVGFPHVGAGSRPPTGMRGHRRNRLRSTGGRAFDGSPNIIEVYVGYLRRKLDTPFGRESLLTVRGSGYRLRPTITRQDDPSAPGGLAAPGRELSAGARPGESSMGRWESRVWGVRGRRRW